MKSVPFFSTTDIEHDFEATLFAQALANQKEGQVTRLDVGHNRQGDWKIKSTVTEPGLSPHHTDIIVTFANGSFSSMVFVLARWIIIVCMWQLR
jgi:hypothetical protein